MYIKTENTLINHTSEIFIKDEIVSDSSDEEEMFDYNDSYDLPCLPEPDVATEKVISIYECHYCETQYASLELFKEHSQLHHKETTNLCIECNRSFCTVEQLLVHQRLHSGEKPYQCNVCEEKFAFQRSLEYHLQLHGGIKIFKCQLCENIYLKLDDLNDHLKYHIQIKRENRFQQSPNMFYPEQNQPLVVYKVIQIDDNSLDTNINCQYDDSSSDNLLIPLVGNPDDEDQNYGNIQSQHAESESDEKISTDGRTSKNLTNDKRLFDCKFCDKSFNAMSGLKIHLAFSHNMKKKFECKTCGLTFPYLKLYQWHLRCRKVGKCHICLVKFCSSKKMKEHLRQHYKEQTKSCAVCKTLTKSTELLPMSVKGSVVYRCTKCLQIQEQCENSTVIKDVVKNQTEINKLPEEEANISKGDDLLVPVIKSSDKPILQCNHCQQSFQHLTSLLRHKNVRRQLECCVCKEKMCSIHKMNIHMKLHNFITKNNTVKDNDSKVSDKTLRCSHCDQLFLRIKYLQRHILERIPMACTVCGKKLCSIYKLKNHMKTHEDNYDEETDKNKDSNSLQCSHCGHEFVRPQNLHRHESERQRLVCRICKKKICSVYKMKIHMKYHYDSDNENVESENIQEAETVKNIDRQEHEESLECKICGKTFTRKNGYTLHMIHTHGTGNNYNCKYCNKPFEYLKHLKIHIFRRNSKNFHLKCKKCPHRFGSQRALTAHIKCHESSSESIISKIEEAKKYIAKNAAHQKLNQNIENDKPILKKGLIVDKEFIEKNGRFCCKICEKAYNTKNGVKAHIVHSHMADKKYKCRICGIAFPFIKLLQKHQQFRSLKRCRHCAKSFCSKTKCLIHERQHRQKSLLSLVASAPDEPDVSPKCNNNDQLTLTEKVTCETCDATFLSVNDLKLHSAAFHSNAKKFFCKDCNIGFQYEKSLAHHYKSRYHGSCRCCRKRFCSETKLRTHLNALPMLNSIVLETDSDYRNLLNNSHSGNDKKNKKLSMIKKRRETQTSINAIDNDNQVPKYSFELPDSNKNDEVCKCNLCGKIYSTLGGLGQHLEAMHAVDSFKCKNCDKSFARIKNLLKHARHNCILRVNKDNIKLEKSDDILDVSNDSISDIQFNLLTEISIKQEKVYDPNLESKSTKESLFCLKCEARFTSLKSLEHHQKIRNTPNYELTCSKCTHKFSCVRSLMTHDLWHNNKVDLDYEPYYSDEDCSVEDVVEGV